MDLLCFCSVFCLLCLCARLFICCELPVSFSWGGMMWILVVVEGILSMCYQ